MNCLEVASAASGEVPSRVVLEESHQHLQRILEKTPHVFASCPCDGACDACPSSSSSSLVSCDQPCTYRTQLHSGLLSNSYPTAADTAGTALLIGLGNRYRTLVCHCYHQLLGLVLGSAVCPALGSLLGERVSFVGGVKHDGGERFVGD